MFRSKQYLLEFASAVVIYAVLLFGASAVDHALHRQGIFRLLINLVPMVGCIAAAWAVLRGLWRMGEMQRRIQFDAIAISFLGTALITFGWVFAESTGVPHLRALQVWPIMGTFWAVGLVIARRRY